MQKRGEQKGFGPVYSGRSRVLVLGSYPSPKSFEQGFYYSHPQNRFWPLMAGLLGGPIPADIAQKTALILDNGLALWDALERCEIRGASDASIRNAAPNDIGALLQKAPIQLILCNGAAAYEGYRRFSQRPGHPPALRMPSTSPANAACSLQKLREMWGGALAGYL